MKTFKQNIRPEIQMLQKTKLKRFKKILKDFYKLSNIITRHKRYKDII